ncbi:acyltransferase family protein [Pseudobutyrivibrio ruminis]|uniref:Acyltransferase family protein n=1 Tax=Pseudobutyrivibrio ruminis DSM 9787 TaxID=1123011 RepID=A0A285SA15_9FIRM|nr:acyltransferase [Pseudobutyrivibrio ruminis]SOC04115.1 Acyltransferase family protein [Pseudobutyrivibrio ruminis DSM 9787]
MKEKRLSQIELLRILSMVMIVAHHVIGCAATQLEGSTYFSYPAIYNNIYILDVGAMFGGIGNDLFILISGYFLASKEELNLINTTKKLFYQIGYSTVVLVIGSFIWYRITMAKEYSNVLLADASNFNSMYWFVGYYFLVLLIGKVVLNKFLNKIDRKQYLELLLILFTVISIGWIGDLLDGLTNGLRLLCTGVFLYSLGGYIKKYNPFNNIRWYVILIIWVCLGWFLYITSYNTRITQLETYVRNQSEETFVPERIFYGNYHIFVLISCILLFEMFRRMNIKTSTIVDFFGKSTFMVYLIHSNIGFNYIYSEKNWMELLYYRPFGFIVEISKYTLYTFLLGVFAYGVYCVIQRVLTKR